MKRFGWSGLILLVMTLMAAQCNTPSEANTSPEGPQAAENSAEEAVSVEENAVDSVVAESATGNTEESAVESEAEQVEEVVTESEVVEAEETIAVPETEEIEAAAEEAVTESDEEAIEENGNVEESKAVAEVDDQAADCGDPFAGVGELRFPHEIWTTKGLTRFVGPDLIDPASDLATNFCLHAADYTAILWGGVPPDGIRPLDKPTFDPITVGDEWLADVQPVIALSVRDEARAYPLAILTRHEIANDEIAGIPVAVTFCPLCNAAIVFKREVNGEVLRFGVSGNLRNSDLIMWDNTTLSWWQQFTGQAIVGDMTGTQLEMIPAPVVAWKDFKEAFPNGTVLSDNGRPYGQNPYVGYDSLEQPFALLGTPDPRLPAMERVLGYFFRDVAVAYPLSVLAEVGVVEDTIDGLGEVVVLYEAGQVSALDQGIIENSREVGSAHMYIPEVDDQKLTFNHNDNIITDNETGSEWDIFGRAVSGELAGAQLEPVLSHPHFWFAWAAFRPDTRIYGS